MTRETMTREEVLELTQPWIDESNVRTSEGRHPRVARSFHGAKDVCKSFRQEVFSRRATPASPTHHWWIVGIGVAVVLVLAGVLVFRSLGRRRP